MQILNQDLAQSVQNMCYGSVSGTTTPNFSLWLCAPNCTRDKMHTGGHPLVMHNCSAMSFCFPEFPSISLKHLGWFPPAAHGTPLCATQHWGETMINQTDPCRRGTAWELQTEKDKGFLNPLTFLLCPKNTSRLCKYLICLKISSSYTMNCDSKQRVNLIFCSLLLSTNPISLTYKLSPPGSILSLFLLLLHARLWVELF